MTPFFSTDQLCAFAVAGSPRCSSCGLYRHCKTPRMEPTGKGKRGILVVAEAPGEQEDDQGIQLVGKSGQLLRKVLRNHGIDLDRDCWKTNAVVCHPRKNQTPTSEQVEACRPLLLRAIRDLRPNTIILLGALSVKSLIGHLWRNDEDPGSIGRWVGWRIPSQDLNVWICPTYHPAYLLRTGDPVLELWFNRHIESALELTEPPWREPPDYANEIDVEYEDSKSVSVLRKMLEYGGRVSFDYETSRLKPDGSGASIVCCAVCWEGKKTIAFPWRGESVKVMRELLVSKNIAKIGANNKFEERWTRQIMGHGVRNWLWDTMLAAHVLDSRSGITSVKFQSFVRLGLRPYDSEIRAYLRADHANEENRIRQAPLDKLLLYNGMDALVEWKLAKLQMGEIQ